MRQAREAGVEDRRGGGETWLAALCLLAALAFHGWGASVGWRNLNLPGCEFRQTQTAMSALFILREKNYSLEYPTPVLGKPWSIPMEFPLYQWTVAKLTEETGWPLTQVGRGVTLACFYLGLPAIYLLLRRLGLRPARAMVVLGFVLCCPLYVFYARSFLIETMAWMFGCWFLLGYVRSVEKRHAGWLAVAAVAGAGAGLVKVTTLLALLFPAFAWTLVWFSQDWRESRRARALGRRAAWCAAAVAVPFAASWWWVRYSDHIKAKSVAGSFLQSANMSGYNFGVGVRFDPAIWAQHWDVIFHEIATVPVLVAAGAIALGVVRARGWLPGLLVFHFFAVQVTFPILYAWHEYYYVAIAMLPMVALGLVAVGLLESRCPRWLAWPLIVGLMLAQARGYHERYYAEQKQRSEGGSELTAALRRVTEPDDVLVIAGADWNSMIPYYAQRRAFMIRRSLENTWEVIEPAFAALRRESVAALILVGEQRANRSLLQSAAAHFDLEARGPAFSSGNQDVYLTRSAVRTIRARAGTLLNLSGLKVPAAESAADEEPAEAVSPEQARTVFANVAPVPARMRFRFGPGPEDGAILAQPDADLWIVPPATATHITWRFGIRPGAYADPRNRTDGVEFGIEVERPDGSVRRLYRRLLDPAGTAADRGEIEDIISYRPAPGEVLRFFTRPGGGDAFDWAYWRRIEVK